MSKKALHLQFLQNAITRMSNHSFVLKGWMVTIVSGLVAVAVAARTPQLILVSWAAILLLWCLDAYFLWREKQFRGLYDVTRTKDEDSIDLDMNPDLVRGQTPNYVTVIRAPGLAPFYIGALLMPVLILWVFSNG